METSVELAVNVMSKSVNEDTSVAEFCMPIEVENSIISYIIQHSAYELTHEPQFWKQMAKDLDIGWIFMRKYFDTYICPKLCYQKTPFTFPSTEQLNLLVKGLLAQKDIKSENGDVTEVVTQSGSIDRDPPQMPVEEPTPNVPDEVFNEEPACSFGTNRDKGSDAGIIGTQHTAADSSSAQSGLRMLPDTFDEEIVVGAMPVSPAVSHVGTAGGLTPNRPTPETEEPISPIQIESSDSDGFVLNTEEDNDGDTSSVDALAGSENKDWMGDWQHDEPQLEIEDVSTAIFDQHIQVCSSPAHKRFKSCTDVEDPYSLSESLFVETPPALLDDSDCIIVTEAAVVIDLIDNTPPATKLRCLICEIVLNVTNLISHSDLCENVIKCTACDNDLWVTSKAGQILMVSIARINQN